MASSSTPFVSIVMPALNEEKYIADSIGSLLPPDGAFDYELLVMDGGSTDKTLDIVRRIAASNSRVKWMHNPRRIQSAAMNIAADACDPKATVMVRADCHAIYPADFVQNCARDLGEADCSSVVVSMRAVGRSPKQKAIAAAQNSRIGNGGSRHRNASFSGYVDHGHHAAFDRAVFRSLGGYDESAPYNEDAEFDARLTGSGRRIYLDGRLTLDYYPRETFAALARQYFRHGWGRANTLIKHAMRPKLRQVLPVLVLLMCIASFIAWPLIGAIALLPPAAYVAACLAWGLLLSIRDRQPWYMLTGPAAITMHLSWAAGFLKRCFEYGMQRLSTSVQSRASNGSLGARGNTTHSE